MARAVFQNLLLRRLSDDHVALLGPITPVVLGARAPLHAPGAELEFAYFPVDCLASIIADNGKGSIEVGIAGREGMTAVALIYGDVRSPFETFIQVPGNAFRIEAGRLREALQASESLRALLLAYANSFATQVAATSVANGQALLEERLARWILMVQDRVGATFHITHEFLATMLAVRRSGVTVALQVLEGRHLIRAARGSLTVVDRAGLLDLAGPTYGLAEREYARLFG